MQIGIQAEPLVVTEAAREPRRGQDTRMPAHAERNRGHLHQGLGDDEECRWAVVETTWLADAGQRMKDDLNAMTCQDGITIPANPGSVSELAQQYLLSTAASCPAHCSQRRRPPGDAWRLPMRAIVRAGYSIPLLYDRHPTISDGLASFTDYQYRRHEQPLI